MLYKTWFPANISKVPAPMSTSIKKMYLMVEKVWMIFTVRLIEISTRTKPNIKKFRIFLSSNIFTPTFGHFPHCHIDSRKGLSWSENRLIFKSILLKIELPIKELFIATIKAFVLSTYVSINVKLFFCRNNYMLILRGY